MVAACIKASMQTVGYYEDADGELQFNPETVIPNSAYAPAEALKGSSAIAGAAPLEVDSVTKEMRKNADILQAAKEVCLSYNDAQVL
jgi:hypothetical protein